MARGGATADADTVEAAADADANGIIVVEELMIRFRARSRARAAATLQGMNREREREREDGAATGCGVPSSQSGCSSKKKGEIRLSLFSSFLLFYIMQFHFTLERAKEIIPVPIALLSPNCPPYGQQLQERPHCAGHAVAFSKVNKNAC